MAETTGVAAVERALTILDAFTDADAELTLAELSKRTAMYKSTVLRLARSLEGFGYLTRAEDGLYRLGPKLLQLGSRYQRHLNTAAIVPGALRSIVDSLKEGASFYVRDGDRRLVLHRVESLRSVRDWVHEGDRLPLNVGAAGHVIRAFGGGTGATAEKVRSQMYAASFGERDPEVAAVACPVFGLHQRLVGAVTVSGPRYRIESLGLERILRVLLDHACELTRSFGGDPQDLARALAALERPARRVARVR
jgi:DNA-binding IclR family transcriptional regulator